MKKLLLLGGSHFLFPVIREAQALGIYTVTCDYLPDNPAHRISDEYRNVSIIEKDAVLALAEELQIDGVMSFACDPGVTTAAYVAEQLGLPNVGPYASVEILQNKDRFRAFLRDHGFPVPWMAFYSDEESPLRDAEHFPWPVIVKPVDSAGSKGVTRIDSPDALSAAVRHAFRNSHCGRIIIEEFIVPKGFPSDTECFSVGGELKFVTWNSQRFDAGAENPYAPAGFSWPSSMTPEEEQNLTDQLQRLLRLLHMQNAVYNIEARVGINGVPYLMEVSPRGGGNRLCEMVQLITGAPMIRNAVKAAVGMPLDSFPELRYDACWAEVILHSRENGIFRGLEIAAEVEPALVEQDMWVQPGDPVEAFSGANKTIGTLVLRFSSPEEVAERLLHQENWLKILVDPA